MANWIRRSRIVETVEYFRSFDYVGHVGWGCSFPCDAAGIVSPSNPDAARNFAACLTGTVDGRAVIDRGVERIEGSYREPGAIRCVCRRTLELQGDTLCYCGREYNSAGQELAPHDQWGEETGETYADLCVNADREDC